MKHLHLLAFLLPFVLFLSSCGDDDEGGEPPRPAENILQIVQDTQGLDSLAQLLTLLGPDFTNQITSSEYTLFAPNNTAFVNLLNRIGLRRMTDLRNGILIDIITYHLVPNTTLRSNQLDSSLTAFNLSVIDLTTEGDSVRINAATQPERVVIVSPDILASNGVVHVTNGVLLSPGIANNIAPTFGTLAGLTNTLTLRLGFQDPADGDISIINNVFGQTGLLNNLRSGGPYTVLAPLNAAFGNFFFTSQQNVSDVAGYHVLQGNVDLTTAGRTIQTLNNQTLYVTNDEGSISLNGIPFVDFGYAASNGRLLFSLGVLRPAEPLADVINYTDDLSNNTFAIFEEALAQADLEIGEDKTIFMPTDSAFQRAGLVTSIDSAARIDPAVLTRILQTHIIDGITFTSDIEAAGTVQATALNDTPLTIAATGSDQSITLTIEDANEETEDASILVGISDQLTDNGVVHVIDELLLPE